MSHGSRRETLRQQIDENLRRVYQEKIEEGIPDRFAQLLDQLRDQGGTVEEETSASAATRRHEPQSDALSKDNS